ncbi:T9SS type A sorting domain-containing protein [Desertivirga xinjiangensis]|uniref:T9SS type A sorting domain-containing protein n=1 Tax=Desertivirga xinjiangensis TaxID=539206 RepID=UPI00210A21BC|nr:T9SS type A sorting domain-containing protein [Pedobacter xinjiangensis]
MKKLFLVGCIALSFIGTQAQTPKSWTYNFGTAEADLSPVSAGGILSANDGVSGHTHASLPAPADGQIARVWTGNQNAAGYTLNNSEVPGFGSGSRLRFLTAPTSSTSKFSILNIASGATPGLLSVKFKLRFHAGVAADYRFAIGGDAGTVNWTTKHGSSQFSNQFNFNDINALPAFLLMHWKLTGSSYKLLIREQKSTSTLTNLDGYKEHEVEFKNGENYDIEIYSNNTSNTDNSSYIKNKVTYTVAARSSQIWVNGQQLLYSANQPNFTPTTDSYNLAAGDPLNAFMFLGYNNADNKALAYLDDFVYANYITDLVTLPVKLSSFTATKQHNGVKLNWSTASEQDNSHFDVLRSANGKDFTAIGVVQGSGTSNINKNYNYIDHNSLSGTSYYQLRQVDFNGRSSVSDVLAVENRLNATESVLSFKDQNLELVLDATKAGEGFVRIADLAGKTVLKRSLTIQKGNNTLQVPVQLEKGIYVVSLSTLDGVVTKKIAYL